MDKWSELRDIMIQYYVQAEVTDNHEVARVLNCMIKEMDDLDIKHHVKGE